MRDSNATSRFPVDGNVVNSGHQLLFMVERVKQELPIFESLVICELCTLSSRLDSRDQFVERTTILLVEIVYQRSTVGPEDAEEGNCR